VHLLGTITYPAVLKVGGTVVALGMLFSLLGALAIGLPAPGAGTPRWLGEGPLAKLVAWAIPATVATGVLLALFLSWIYTPKLSEHFSYKNVFDAYFDARHGDEPLGVSGIAGSGPDFYSRGTHQPLNGSQALIAFLQGEGRVFAIAPATELCTINVAMNAAQRAYHVVHAENSRFFLYSNQLGGQRDVNPLNAAIFREPPASVGREVSATFEPAAGGAGEIELIGIDMPESVAKRSRFKMTLWFHVVERPAANYKIFVHFDKGVRFQADHDPIRGLCGTSLWQPGDYIADTFEVEAGDLTHPKGQYTVLVGFFTGTNPNWKNMKVTSGNGDKADRVTVGTITVR
jgi:hypothetical protein